MLNQIFAYACQSYPMFLLSVASFAAIMSIVVFVHEFGHYIAAVVCGIEVEQFSIGFGKELVGIMDRRGTRWKICLWPLGGYIKMRGDSNAASFTSTIRDETSFAGQPVWKRAITIFAGPFANFVFGFAVFTAMFYLYGQMVIPPRIGEIVPNSAAARDGLMVGDFIKSLDGQSISTFQDLTVAAQANNGSPVIFTVLRDGIEKNVNVTPEVALVNQGVFGIRKTTRFGIGAGEYVKDAHSEACGLIGCPELALKQIYNTAKITYVNLSGIVSGQKSADNLSGPIGIAQATGNAVKALDLPFILNFIGSLSLSLGLFNLLPIPLMDGGHLVLFAIESVRRKPLGAKVENALLWIGGGLVLLMMVVSTISDMIRLF